MPIGVDGDETLALAQIMEANLAEIEPRREEGAMGGDDHRQVLAGAVAGRRLDVIFVGTAITDIERLDLEGLVHLGLGQHRPQIAVGRGGPTRGVSEKIVPNRRAQGAVIGPAGDQFRDAHLLARIRSVAVDGGGQPLDGPRFGRA